MNDKKPVVSIITPSFNQGQYIEETLLSVQNQTYPSIEHIVIDGGSTDNTVEILKKYQDTIIWTSEPDNGQTHAINKGMKKSHGEILAYLNSDDLYLPETIDRVVNFFSENSEIDLVYGDIIHIGKESDYRETVRTGNIDMEKYLTGLVYLPQPAVFFRREIWEKIGDFDERLNLAMDLEYWIRVFFHGKTAYLPVVLAKARIYPEAKSSKHLLNYLEEKLYILDKNFCDERIIASCFGSRENAKKIERKARSYVYFYGGLAYQERKQMPVAIPNIVKGIILYPRHLMSPFLYWYLFILIVGTGIGKKISPYMKKPDRLNNF